MTTDSTDTAWVAFDRSKRVAQGEPREVAAKIKAWTLQHTHANVLIFDAATSQPVELDLRGSVATVLKRVPQPPDEPVALPLHPRAAAAKTPGRPRLGVVAREVTLLPRHWEWLATQPGGASVALRKLVEHARRDSRHADQLRVARESAYRFISAMAGDEPGFEDTARALFHGDVDAAVTHMARWPADVRKHAARLLESTRAQEAAAAAR